MASLIGNIFISTIRRFFNVNPLRSDSNMVMLEKLCKKEKPFIPKGYIREVHDLGGYNVEVFYKDGTTPKNVVYFLHGGGYIGNLTNMYRKRTKQLAEAGHNAKVIFIDYNVAPKHVYPTQLEEALRCYDWILSLGHKEEEIITVGDSAGGNLNLAMNLRLRDAGRKLPKALVCISPWADMLGEGDSYMYNFKKDPMFGDSKTTPTKDLFEKFVHIPIYTFCDNADRTSPYVSPVLADYYGFPPMFATVGGDEMLYSDTERIYQNFIKNGIECKMHVDKKMFHVYPLFTPLFKEARNAFGAICNFISEKLD